MSLRAYTLALIALASAPQSTAGIIYETDFSEVVVGDVDGKVLPPVAVFPALALSPGVWHRNSSATTSFISAGNTSVTDSVPPVGTTGNAAARIGDDSATVVYLHQVLSQVIVAGTDYDFSFATRLALADGSIGEGEAAAGQVTLSVGCVNDDNTLNGFFGTASIPVNDISADQWTTHGSLLSASDIPTNAIGKRMYLRLTHNVENTPDYFVWVDFLRVNAAEQSSSELSTAMTLLKNHINGTALLTISQINALTVIIDSNRGQVDDNAATVTQALDLISTYETIKGPLFVSTPVVGSFTRTDTSTVVRALGYSMLRVQQAVMDIVYTATNLAKYSTLLNGAKFLTSSYFPGSVTPPANPASIYSVQINASQPEAWGFPVMYQDEPARRPTGAYLAPGSIATVTVPPELVNQGFQIRVGAHVHDLSNKTTVKRMDRVSRVYPITSLTTQVANPLGGGIYVEVPYKMVKGLVTVQITNAVRSPFYSNTIARQTSLTEWQTTERLHPGPWADFETDKSMFNFPRGWIYNYADPVTMMNNWDLAMDGVSELIGMPLVRPKTVLYAQIDVLFRTGANSPGYPQSNDAYNPNAAVNGNQDHQYLNGPKFADYAVLHELGHACLITKFAGEVEANVNLLNVPVQNRKFGVNIDEAFGRSMGNEGCKTVTRDQAALMWILSDKFRAGNAMTVSDMNYQHRGYGKYVDIAALFGWEALGDFWHSVGVDYMNGIEYPTNSDPADSRILRMSRAAGVDLTPLIHFWGVPAQNLANLKSAMLAEGLKPSAEIYDRILHYQSILPMNLTEFESHYQAIKGAPRDQAWYDAMRTAYTQAMGNASVSRVQAIINLHFPNGRPQTEVSQQTLYHTDFANEVNGDADGKVLPPVAVFPAISTSPDIWHRNSTATTSFFAAENTTATSSTPPAGADGNAAARIGNDSATLVYLHAVLTDVFTAATDYDFSFATRLALADGGAGSVPGATGQVKLSVGYVNADNSLNSFFSTASIDITNVAADAWGNHTTQLFKSAIPTDAIGKRIYLRLTHNIANTPGYFVWVDNFRIVSTAKVGQYADWARVRFAESSSNLNRTMAGNPDGDSLNNGLEWALVTNPLTQDSPALSTFTNPTHFIVQYQRRLNSGYEIEASWSESLTSPGWRKDSMVEVPVGQTGDVETIAVSVPFDSPVKFVRVGATE
ncbi:MAG: M60 family peptidase N-terminal accessory domain-containing protein [Akkermansiaceae bacterium]